MIVINLTAVLVAAIVQMVLGALWYGPLFGKPWAKLVNFTEEMRAAGMKRGMRTTYAMAFVNGLVMVYVLAQFIYFINPDSVASALQIGFWLWLGFVATSMMGQILWLNKPTKLYAIDSSYYLVALMVNSVILTLWQ